MSTVKEIIDILLEIPGTVAIKSGVMLEADKLEIYPILKLQQDRSDAVLSMIEFEAEHEDLIDDMIVDYAVGLGDDKTASLRETVRIWTEGTLPVLRHLVSDNLEGVLPVEKGKIEALTESGDTLVWDVTIGPLQGVGLTSSTATTSQALINVLRPQLEPLLANPEDIWVRAVVTRADEHIDVDCVLNNRAWTDGYQELFKWVMDWDDCDGLQMRRQFMYFKLVK